MNSALILDRYFNYAFLRSITKTIRVVMNLSTFIITVSPDPGRGSITTYFSENWCLFTKFNKRRRNLSIELKIKKVTEFLPSIDLSCLGHGWILGAFQETGSSSKIALIAFQQMA